MLLSLPLLRYFYVKDLRSVEIESKGYTRGLYYISAVLAWWSATPVDVNQGKENAFSAMIALSTYALRDAPSRAPS